MTAMNPQPRPDSGEARKRRELWIERFETAWLAGREPLIEVFLPDEAAERRVTLIELVHAELELRLKAGETVAVEDYLQRFPELADDPQVALELIAMEFEFRHRREPDLSLGDYRRRFPQFDDELRTTLQRTPAQPSDVPVAGVESRATRPQRSVAETGQDSERTGAEELSPEPTAACSAPAVTGLPMIPGHEVLEVLGRGAMGVVYKARHLKLNRLVAVKMILSGSHAGPDQLARFKAEAEAVARLQHPNIVQIYEVGEQDGLPFFSLEYVDGDSLDKKLAGAPQPVRQAAELVQTLTEAMHTSHQQGIIHRDLKPANVLVTANGTPKITDFGLAKQLDQEAGQTRTGAVMGTPSYMAPEQAAGRTREIGPATDVYALGAILYEVLSGRPPFRAATVHQTLRQVIEQEPVAPRQLNPAIDRDVETICLKCLHKEPGKRYGSAQALAQDLERFLKGEPIRARRVGWAEQSVKWMKRRPAVAGLVGLGVLLLMALVGLVYYGGLAAERNRAVAAEQEAQRLRDDFSYARSLVLAQRELEAGHQGRAVEILDACNWKLRGWEWQCLRHNTSLIHTIKGQWVRTVCFSPDGQRLASGCSNSEVWLWDARTGRALRAFRGLEGEVSSVCFSPDGQRLASGGDDKRVRLWNVQTGKVLCLLEGHEGHVNIGNSICFSPDGQLVAGAGLDNTVRLWDARTGQELRSLQGHTESVRVSVSAPTGSAWPVLETGRSSQTIHTLCGCGMCGPASKWARSWGTPQRLPASVSAPTGSAWSVVVGTIPCGCGMYKRARSCVPFRGTPQGLPASVSAPTDCAWPVAVMTIPCVCGMRGMATASAPFMGTRTRYIASVLARRQRLVSGGYDMTVRLWDVRIGQERRPLTEHTAGVNSVCFSPDGRRLASSASGGWGNAEVKVWDVRSGQATLTLPGLDVTSVCFSSDGQYLAGVSEPFAKSSRDLHVWDARTGQATLTRKGLSFRLKSVCFSPDGLYLAVANVDDTGKRNLRLWEARTGHELRSFQAGDPKTPFEVDIACFSPDGRILAGGGGSSFVQLWDVETGQQLRQVVEAALGSICFRPDGQVLAVAEGNNVVLSEVWTGRLLRILEGHIGTVFSVCFSPDGQRLASGGEDRTVRLWDVRTGQELLALPGHTARVASVCFSPDGHRLASGSADRTVRVWDARTGQELRFLREIRYGLGGVGFSQDKQRIVAKAGIHKLETLAWSLETGQLLKPCTDPPPPDAQLEAKSADGSVTVWIGGYYGPDGKPTVWLNDDRVHVLRQEDAERARKEDLALGQEWHLQQALEAEKAKEWFAAAFHLNRLVLAEKQAAAAQPSAERFLVSEREVLLQMTRRALESDAKQPHYLIALAAALEEGAAKEKAVELRKAAKVEPGGKPGANR